MTRHDRERGDRVWRCGAHDCPTETPSRLGPPDGWWAVSRRLATCHRTWTVRVVACTINCLDVALGDDLERLEREETRADRHLLTEVAP